VNRLLRVKEICRDPTRPEVAPLIDISLTSWWRGVREGRFPAGRLIGPRTRVWEYKELLAFIESTSADRGAR
jgi:predicted DNA-binding transcriptional regulator AlpA